MGNVKLWKVNNTEEVHKIENDSAEGNQFKGISNWLDEWMHTKQRPGH